MNYGRLNLIAGVFLTGLLLKPLWGTADEPKLLRRFDFERIEMGVDFRIGLYACDSRVANDAATAAFDRVRELNSKLSDYEATSEVRRLCERPHRQWHSVSRDLHTVLLHAAKLSGETDGAFDVTVGHYTKLWRRARRRKLLPDPDQVAELADRTGFQLLKVDSERPRVWMAKGGMRIDLGGIAKGYAVDEALTVLCQAGIDRAFVDGSGDIAVGKPPPGKAAWRIEIAALRESEDSKPVSIEVSECAVATSGDAFQAVEIGGRRYSHIVNPKTGQPLSTSSSVTIVSGTGIEADSVASAISVLGPMKGIPFAEKKAGTESYVITVQSGKTRSTFTSGFGALRVNEPAAGAPESARAKKNAR